MIPLASMTNRVGQPWTPNFREIGPVLLPPFQNERHVIFASLFAFFTAAFFSSLDVISGVSPTVADAIVQELRDQRANLKLIASPASETVT